MICLILDNTSQEPLYIQIYNQISNKIHKGELKGGTKMPSQRTLANETNVSVNTVINAYNLLNQYGYITPRERSGYYVKEISHSNTIYSERTWHSDTPSVYNFSRNGVDLTMNADFKRTFRRCVKEYTDHDFSYPDYNGNYELRKQICSMVNRTLGINCTPVQIIVGAGVEYLVDALIRVIGHDKIFAHENPSYYKTSNYMKLGTEKLKFLNLGPDGLVEDEIKGLEADVLFTMPYKHYPMGHTMTPEQKNWIIDWANSDRYVIEYGYDMDFVFNTKSETLYNMNNNKNIIFMGDFSKNIAPSINIAYLVLPDNFVNIWQEQYSQYHSLSSQIEQRFISEIIKNGSFYKNIRRLKKKYLSKQKIIISSLSSHKISDRIIVRGIKAGTFVTIEVVSDCSEDTLIEVAHNAGVKLGYVKNALNQPNDNLSLNTFILGFGELSEDEIRTGIKVLLDTWEKYI